LAEKFLSLSGMQTLWNKVKSVFATKTDVNKKLDVNHVNLNGLNTTILAEVQVMGVNGIHYKRFFTSSDDGSANIPDKPTGNSNAGFVLEAICNRRNSSNDFRYVLLCYVQGSKPKIAWVTNNTTSITWNNLDSTLGTMSVDEGKTGTATTNRGLTAKNLKEIITNYLSQFEGNEKEVTFNTVNSSDGELASERFVATYYEKLLEVGQGLEINDKSDGTCRIIRMKSLGNPTTLLFKNNSGYRLPIQLTFNTMGQFVAMSQDYDTLPIPSGFGSEGQVLLSNGDGNIPTWQSFPANLKRVQGFTNYIKNTNSYANLSLFKQTNASSRLHVDADIALYGNGSAADFKILISFGSNSSGSIFKQRICVIPYSDSFTPTFELRKDSAYGYHTIVWTNCPKSVAEIYVSINSYKAQGFLVPSLIFYENASSFGTTNVTANVKVV
jgi:hypothetical protein